MAGLGVHQDLIARQKYNRELEERAISTLFFQFILQREKDCFAYIKYHTPARPHNTQDITFRYIYTHA